MRRALVLLVLLAAACKADPNALPDGSYAGSTQDRQPITVDVGGGKVRVDGLETRVSGERRFVQKKAPHLAVRCRTAPQRELHCELTRGGTTESVELMRL